MDRYYPLRWINLVRCGVSSHDTRHPNQPIPFLSPTTLAPKKNGPSHTSLWIIVTPSHQLCDWCLMMVNDEAFPSLGLASCGSAPLCIERAGKLEFVKVGANSNIRAVTINRKGVQLR